MLVVANEMRGVALYTLQRSGTRDAEGKGGGREQRERAKGGETRRDETRNGVSELTG